MKNHVPTGFQVVELAHDGITKKNPHFLSLLTCFTMPFFKGSATGACGAALILTSHNCFLLNLLAHCTHKLNAYIFHPSVEKGTRTATVDDVSANEQS
jgi:hypothetical protein